MTSKPEISVERTPSLEQVAVATPWGDSGTLRDRKLQPVRGASADEVRQSQRERLFAATIACVAERGFAATTVEDLVELSGVSRRSFYDNFGDKAECLTAALEETLSLLLSLLKAGEREPGLEAEWLRAYQVFTGIAVAQPATAKVCVSSAFAAGGDAVEALCSAVRGWEELSGRSYEASPEHAGMPAGLVSARIGGVLEIVRSRLRTGNEGELAALAPDIVNLAIADRPPPEPLRLSVRTPKAKPESLDAADHSERAIRAFALLCAERGYPNVKVDDILRLASMSPTTFYANFSGREDLLAAAIDQACAQAVAAVVPAFNRHDSLPDAIRAGFGALLNFLASRPALTKLVTVEVYAAGDAAIERRIEGLAPLSALLVNNTTMWSSTPPIVYEMISGGVAHLLHDTVRNDGPQALPALAPLCTYLSLSPFLGPEESCAAANGDGGRRSTEEREDSSGPAQPFGAKAVSYDEVMNSVSWRVMAMLAGRDKTAAELAIEAGVDEELIVKYLNRLHAAGEIESTGVRDGKNLYRTAPMHPLNVASTQQMASLTPDERDERLISIWRMMRIELDVAASGGFLRDRPDTFLTRTPMWVDDEGWLELQELHGQTLKAGMEIAKRNRERLEESGGRRFEIQSFQAAFEVPELPTWLPRPDEPGAE